jgi:sn-glycerol 3-phosphate transport system permease protein
MTAGEAVRTPAARRRADAQGTGVRWYIVMAGNVVLSAPVLALFALVQKQLLRAVTG